MGMSALFEAKMKGPNRAFVAGSFVTVSSSNPTVTDGKGFSVTRSGAGVYVVTLEDTANDIDCIIPAVALATETDVAIINEDAGARANPAFTLRLWVAPAPATPVFAAADDAGSIVSFIAVLRNTNVV